VRKMEERTKAPGGRRRTDIFRRLWSRYQEDVGAQAEECPFCKVPMAFVQQNTGNGPNGEVFTVIWRCPECATQMAEAHIFHSPSPGPAPNPKPTAKPATAPDTEPECEGDSCKVC